MASAAPGVSAGAPPRLSAVARVFTRYANFTFGGGNSTVAVLHHELLEKRRWIGTEHFALCFALARLTPGTNLLAFCTGVGWVLRRVPGGIAALLAASIPCSIILLVVTALLQPAQHNPWGQTLLRGAVAAAIAISARTAFTIVRPYFKGAARLRVGGIAAGAFGLNMGIGLSPIEILAIAALLGAALPTGPR
jgi:chromate transporter